MYVNAKTHGGLGYSVSLNGKQLDLVIEADDKIGYAIVQRLDADGHAFIDSQTGDIARHRFEGEIQISKGEA